MKRQDITYLLSILLLIFWATRVFKIDSFPPFIDEAFHVGVAEYISETGGILAYAGEGRIFSIWWYLIFQPASAGDAIWLVRVATLLAVLPGIAALIATGRLAAGIWGGVLTGLVYLFSTYHMFFDRLALSDTVSNAAIALGLYFAYRLSRRIDGKDAALAGFALFLAVGAKIGALPYLGIPLAAAVTLGPRTYGWVARGRWFIVSVVTMLLPLAALYLVARWRGQDIFLHIQSTSSGGDQVYNLNRIRENLERTLELAASYFGPAVVLLLMACVVWLLLRQKPYFPLVLLAPTLVIALSMRQSTRYVMTPLTVLLLCGAVVLALLARSSGMLGKGVPVVAVLLWGVWQWAPFAAAMYRNPIDLPVSPADRAEYIQSDASGFGIHQVAAELVALEPGRVIGILPNCGALRYKMLRTVPVECPRLNPSGEDISTLETLMADSRHAGTYVVLEDSPYAPDTAPGKLHAVIEHESGRPRLSIYDLAP
ncbi:MAG: hypothetical protein GX613_17500 [Chloroflexi bacterium]|nr:hypothetical protein [Chloroflexota bacterium]